MAFIDKVLDFLGSGARKAYDSIEEEIYHAIQHRVRAIERRIKREAISIVVLLSGAVFLMLSLIYFMIEYLAFSRTISFLIPAILLLLIGMFMRMSS